MRIGLSAAWLAERIAASLLGTNEVAIAVVVLKECVGGDGLEAVFAYEVVDHVDVAARMTRRLVFEHDTVELEVELTAKTGLDLACALWGDVVVVGGVFPWSLG